MKILGQHSEVSGQYRIECHPIGETLQDASFLLEAAWGFKICKAPFAP